MPEDYTHLRILVASPDDVGEERAVIQEVIAEFNRTWARSSQVWLEGVAWETDIHPDFGDDPQDVVNNQVGDDYDIFVGILGNRFGTPTQRAGSGTEEEFERAYARHKTNPRSIRIMMYFSRSAIQDPDTVDPDEFKKVRLFREKVSKLGGLYARFDSVDEFGKKFQFDLARQAQGWGKSWGVGIWKKTQNLAEKDASPALVDAEDGLAKDQGESENRTQPGTAEGDVSSAPNQLANGKLVLQAEEGLLNLIEEGAEQVEVVTQSAQRMTEAIRVLGERMENRTKQLGSLKLGPDITSVRIVRRIADETAQEMMQFVDVVDGEVPSFAIGYSKMLDVYGRAALLLTEGPQPDTSAVENTLENLAGLKSSLLESRVSLRAFRQSIEKIPPMSSDLIRADKRSLLALERLDQEWGKAIDLSAEVEQMLKKVFAHSKPRRRRKRTLDADAS